jgi:hypothetical protein
MVSAIVLVMVVLGESAGKLAAIPAEEYRPGTLEWCMSWGRSYA